MPVINVKGQELYLISYEVEGIGIVDPAFKEVEEPNGGGYLSERVVELIEGNSYTDAFIFSHGFLNSLDDAERAYPTWVEAMMNTAHGQTGFKPLLVGLHWPSKCPWESSSLSVTGKGMEEGVAEQAFVDALVSDAGRRPW